MPWKAPRIRPTRCPTCMSRGRRGRLAASGGGRAERVVAAVGCGTNVNPNTVEAQSQSGIIFGISAARWGEITLKDGRVGQHDFNDSRVLRLNEAPAID